MAGDIRQAQSQIHILKESKNKVCCVPQSYIMWSSLSPCRLSHTPLSFFMTANMSSNEGLKVDTDHLQEEDSVQMTKLCSPHTMSKRSQAECKLFHMAPIRPTEYDLMLKDLDDDGKVNLEIRGETFDKTFFKKEEGKLVFLETYTVYSYGHPITNFVSVKEICDRVVETFGKDPPLTTCEQMAKFSEYYDEFVLFLPDFQKFFEEFQSDVVDALKSYSNIDVNEHIAAHTKAIEDNKKTKANEKDVKTTKAEVSKFRNQLHSLDKKNEELMKKNEKLALEIEEAKASFDGSIVELKDEYKRLAAALEKNKKVQKELEGGQLPCFASGNRKNEACARCAGFVRMKEHYSFCPRYHRRSNRPPFDPREYFREIVAEDTPDWVDELIGMMGDMDPREFFVEDNTNAVAYLNYPWVKNWLASFATEPQEDWSKRGITIT